MMKKFDVKKTEISDLIVLKRNIFEDDRGSLDRIFCFNELSSFTKSKSPTQINYTKTKYKNTVRGLHFQYAPFSETKIISCLKGSIFDVAVDLRKNSPTYLKWHSEIITDKNHKSFLIPEGFAHGYQTLSDNCELLYIHTSAYKPDFEDGINPFDDNIKIKWPNIASFISDRDKSHKNIKDGFEGLTVEL